MRANESEGPNYRSTKDSLGKLIHEGDRKYNEVQVETLIR